MFSHPYVIEKLIELEKRPASHVSRHDLPRQHRRANGFALSVARTMRRTGERLEAWAGPGPQSRPDCVPEPKRY